MVVSTAGHWTTSLFGGYGDKSEVMLEDAKKGIDGVLDFFEHAMTKWAGEIQKMLDDAARKESPRKKREVVVRAYLTGHEDCHQHREPWKEIQPFVWGWYNWGQIGQFNDIFEVPFPICADARSSCSRSCPLFTENTNHLTRKIP
jgi:hypothetical protein